MKKIIASSDQKDPILRKLSSQNHGIVTDTQIIPLSTFLKEEKDDDLVLSIQLSNKLLQAQILRLFLKMVSNLTTLLLYLKVIHKEF